MKNTFSLFLLVFSIAACKQPENPHYKPTHNFTVKRLLIINDQQEILMGKEDSNWYTPVLIYKERQYVREGLDSLAQAYGLKITVPELRAYVSYKYEYHPYSTLRGFYVAKYVSGDLQVPADIEDAKWMPYAEAIRRTPVNSMKEITQQVLTYPDTLWGASFLVYKEGEEHQTKVVEKFYPLFK